MLPDLRRCAGSARGIDRAAAAADARRHKYERMGWSKAKIDRALADSEEALAQSRHTVEPGLRDAVSAIVADLAAKVGEVRLLVHFFSGSFAEERVEPRGTVRMSAAELRNGGGRTVLDDTVYVI